VGLPVRRLVVLDHDLADSSTFDRLHSKRPVLVGVDRSGLGYHTRQIEDETGEGDVLALGNRNAERLFHLVDVGLSVDEPAV